MLSDSNQTYIIFYGVNDLSSEMSFTPFSHRKSNYSFKILKFCLYHKGFRGSWSSINMKLDHYVLIFEASTRGLSLFFFGNSSSDITNTYVIDTTGYESYCPLQVIQEIDQRWRKKMKITHRSGMCGWIRSHLSSKTIAFILSVNKTSSRHIQHSM